MKFPTHWQINILMGTYSTYQPRNSKDKDWLLAMLEHDRDSADTMALVEIEKKEVEIFEEEK